jgi:hypothetical protein
VIGSSAAADNSRSCGVPDVTGAGEGADPDRRGRPDPLPQPLPRYGELARRTFAERSVEFLARRTDAFSVWAPETVTLRQDAGPAGPLTERVNVRVTAHEVPLRQRLDVALVLLVDLTARLDAALPAVEAAISALPAGTSFAVHGQGGQAVERFPESGLAVATRSTREAARRALRGWRATPGPSIDGLLRSARRLLDGRREVSRHAILFGRGSTDHGSARGVPAGLPECAAVFTCDVLAVESLVVPYELARIADHLDGAKDGIWGGPWLADMASMFVRWATTKGTYRETLRIRTPAGVAVSDIATAYQRDTGIAQTEYSSEFVVPRPHPIAEFVREPDRSSHECVIRVPPGHSMDLDFGVEVDPDRAPAACQVTVAALDADRRPVQTPAAVVTFAPP